MHLTKASSVVYRILVIAYLGILVAGIVGRLDSVRLGVAVQQAPNGTFVITDVRVAGAVWYVQGAVGDVLETVDGVPGDRGALGQAWRQGEFVSNIAPADGGDHFRPRQR